MNTSLCSGKGNLISKSRTYVCLKAFCFLFFLSLFSQAALAADSDKHFLWRVTGEENTSYILGSIHMAKPGLYPLSDTIESSFEKSDVLVVEADVTSGQAGLMETMLARGIYPEGETLEENISAKTKKRLEELGMQLPLINKMRPWLVSMTIQANALKSLGYDENYGLDIHFLKRAKNTNMDIKELEGLTEQISLLASLSEEYGDTFLYYSLLEIEKLESTAEKIFTAWQQGDVEAFTQYTLSAMDRYPEIKPVYERLFVQRNKIMTEKILSYLNLNETHFVIVGAGHLIGDEGIVELLRKRGYKVDQL